jgi:hypothetical protein
MIKADVRTHLPVKIDQGRIDRLQRLVARGVDEPGDLGEVRAHCVTDADTRHVTSLVAIFLTDGGGVGRPAGGLGGGSIVGADQSCWILRNPTAMARRSLLKRAVCASRSRCNAWRIGSVHIVLSHAFIGGTNSNGVWQPPRRRIKPPR